MKKRKVWLLHLVLPGRFGGVLTALLVFALLVPLFMLGISDDGVDNPPVMFFSLVPAYLIPLFKFITERARQSLDELRPILTIDSEAYAEYCHRMDSQTLRSALGWLVFAVLCALGHMVLLRGSPGAAVAAALESAGGFFSTLGAVLIWVVMTTVIVKLVEQAIIFSRLGQYHTRVSLLNFEGLLPFGRVSMSASLVVIGALALFPLINLGEESHLAESVPGAVAALVPLVVMFVIPVWPLHKRLRRLKSTELRRVNAQIARTEDGTEPVDLTAQGLTALTPLLIYRREIAHTPTWPFDLGNVARLAFYLVIIPMTWVGAALIENVVDAFL